MPINRSRFLRHDENGQSFITTHRLRDYLQDWRDQHHAARADHKRLEHSREEVIKCFFDSYTIWHMSEGSLAAPVGLEIELSIRFLATTLEHAVTSLSLICEDCAYKPWINNVEYSI